MTASPARQPAKAGDCFQTGPTRVLVTRVSRNPQKPWVDIDVSDAAGFMWSKRMPTGIPATWRPIDAAGNPREVSA